MAEIANVTTPEPEELIGPYDSKTEVLHSIAWVLLPLTVIGFFGNATVLVLHFIVRKLRGLRLVLLTNLAVTDLLVTITVLPHLIYHLLTEEEAGKMTCQILGFMHSVLTKSSQLTMAVIAYDRYKAVITSRKNTSGTSRQMSYAVGCMCFIWVQSVVYTTVSLFMVDSQKEAIYVEGRYFCIMTNARNWLYALLMFGVCFVQSASILLFCYARVIRIAGQHLRSVNEEGTRNSQHGAPSQEGLPVEPEPEGEGVGGAGGAHPVQRMMVAQSPELPTSTIDGGNPGDETGQNANPSVFTISSMNTSKRRYGENPLELVGLIAMFLLCWVPIQIDNLSTASGERERNNYHFTTLAIALSLLTSCGNPFLYALGSHHYRTSMRGLMRRNSRLRKLKREQAVARVDFLVYKKCQNAVNNEMRG